MAIIQRSKKECGASVRHFVDGGKVVVCGFNKTVVRDDRRGFVRFGSACEDGLQALLKCPIFRDELIKVKTVKLQEQGGNIDFEKALKGAGWVSPELLDEVGARVGGGVQALGIADLYTVAHVGKYGVPPDTDQLSYAVGRMANLGVRVPEVEAPVEPVVVAEGSKVARRKPRIKPEPTRERQFTLMIGGRG